MGRTIPVEVAGRRWFWKTDRGKEVFGLERAGEGSKVDADWTERRERGDTGGEGGRRKGLGVDELFVSVISEPCIIGVLGVAGGEGGFDMVGIPSCK